MEPLLTCRLIISLREQSVQLATPDLPMIEPQWFAEPGGESFNMEPNNPSRMISFRVDPHQPEGSEDNHVEWSIDRGSPVNMYWLEIGEVDIKRKRNYFEYR